MRDSDVHGDRPRRFLINEPAVIADLVDGEAVIMNLPRGSYYSLDQTGSEIWRLIVAGVSTDDIAAALAERYGLERAAASRDVDELVARMLEQGLIVAGSGTGAPDGSAAAHFPLAEYVPPALSVYTDMKDLLALDPPLPEFKPSKP